MAWGDQIIPNENDPQDAPMELEGVTAQEFDTVRSFLNTGITAGDLPDSVIGNDGYFVSARRDVHEQLGATAIEMLTNPSNPGYTAEKEKIYRLCVMLLTGVYMCHSVPDLTSEALGPIRRSWDETDWLSKEAKLNARFSRNMGRIQPPREPVSSFVAVRGRRGTFGRRRR